MCLVSLVLDIKLINLTLLSLIWSGTQILAYESLIVSQLPFTSTYFNTIMIKQRLISVQINYFIRNLFTETHFKEVTFDRLKNAIAGKKILFNKSKHLYYTIFPHQLSMNIMYFVI